jgi:hypothetical protein
MSGNKEDNCYTRYYQEVKSCHKRLAYQPYDRYLALQAASETLAKCEKAQYGVEWNRRLNAF